MTFIVIILLKLHRYLHYKAAVDLHLFVLEEELGDGQAQHEEYLKHR
jgi:hypothetical protein